MHFKSAPCKVQKGWSSKAGNMDSLNLCPSFIRICLILGTWAPVTLFFSGRIRPSPVEHHPFTVLIKIPLLYSAFRANSNKNTRPQFDGSKSEARLQPRRGPQKRSRFPGYEAGWAHCSSLQLSVSRRSPMHASAFSLIGNTAIDLPPPPLRYLYSHPEV